MAAAACRRQRTHRSTKHDRALSIRTRCVLAPIADEGPAFQHRPPADAHYQRTAGRRACLSSLHTSPQQAPISTTSDLEAPEDTTKRLCIRLWLAVYELTPNPSKMDASEFPAPAAGRCPGGN